MIATPIINKAELMLKISTRSGSSVLFNIQFNGVWPVTLEICNRGGQCGKTEYEIFFGPFVDIRTASDDRCSIDEPFLSLRDVVIGNTGITTKGALYLGVQRLDGSEVITT